MSNRPNDNDNNNVHNSDKKESESHHISPNTNGNVQSPHMTVHSAPLNIVNKNIATPLNQNDLPNRKAPENINNLVGENTTAYQNTSTKPPSTENISILTTNSSNINYQVCTYSVYIIS